MVGGRLVDWEIRRHTSTKMINVLHAKSDICTYDVRCFQCWMWQFTYCIPVWLMVNGWWYLWVLKIWMLKFNVKSNSISCKCKVESGKNGCLASGLKVGGLGNQSNYINFKCSFPFEYDVSSVDMWHATCVILVIIWWFTCDITYTYRQIMWSIVDCRHMTYDFIKC